jgi:hypothetical protein
MTESQETTLSNLLAFHASAIPHHGDAIGGAT